MKPFKYKNKIWRFIVVKVMRMFSSGTRARYPKKVTDQEKTASTIFMTLLKDPNSKLYYESKRNECYLDSESKKMKLFLEAGNIKVINSTYGYDVPISNEMEYYLEARFKVQMNKRRSEFKEKALSKVEHSLNKTLEKIT